MDQHRRPADSRLAARPGGAARLLDLLLHQLLARHPGAASARATVPRPHAAPPRRLSLPGKLVSDGGERVAVADTGHDRVVVCTAGGQVLDTFDGFSQPQGVRFDAGRLVVCDTVAGELIAVSLADGT